MTFMRMHQLALPIFTLAQVADAQTPTPPDTTGFGTRSIALTAGLGNLYGGLGASVEKYLVDEALSASLGIGGFPTTDETPGTAALAVAVRGYSRGMRHRAFLEASLSLIALSYDFVGGEFDNVERHYGPGLSGGYHYTAKKGFTFTLSAGAGWAVGPGRFDPVGALGFGHTWR